METFWSTSHAAGAQSSYLESLYESYLENPSSVPDDWTAPDLSQYGEELVDPETP